ncbi:hypothetical protein D3OALGB2SA_5452 [Olavius algarvensis associated proteobacterium Delta 3]|nr:hypothetical protein D3OALGB2SA_5452 [Olavius algarvensis associated proteobacterium Delta 3]
MGIRKKGFVFSIRLWEITRAGAAPMTCLTRFMQTHGDGIRHGCGCRRTNLISFVFLKIPI